MIPLQIQPVILCGGAGVRLWPLSRAGFPKQFLALSGNESLFQQAARRLTQLAAQDIVALAPLIVGNEAHRFLMLEQLRECGITPAAVLLEPSGRNTAPALTLAALAALDSGADPVLVVTPADQIVGDVPAFTQALQAAIRVAAEGVMVILGIRPDRPETGYGYIHAQKNADEKSALRVEQFVEKPDQQTALRYLATGDYYWNSGIFVLRASVWLAALERFRPDIALAARTAWSVKTLDDKLVRPGKAEFNAIPADSVDYAVMEKCPGNHLDLRMLPLAADWNDLGAWDAVWQVSDKDAAGNVSVGDVMLTDSRNSLVHATSRLVSVVGMDNVIVVETPDAVLVIERSRSQEVKQIVAQLDARQREEHQLHRKVHRPWGWYDSIDEGHHFKVKRIMVRPGASLSLQKHRHRAEHWVVVSGTAEIVCGDKTLRLSQNQSTYIPLGETHRLANPGDIPLEIIEVQSGAYLGEDDIVRFEDHYGRTQ